jgi:hypothetical protein
VPRGSTYFRNEVISVSPDLARREKHHQQHFLGDVSSIVTDGSHRAGNPLPDYISRTNSGHFTSRDCSDRRSLRTQCTVTLDISLRNTRGYRSPFVFLRRARHCASSLVVDVEIGQLFYAQ